MIKYFGNIVDLHDLKYAKYAILNFGNSDTSKNIKNDDSLNIQSPGFIRNHQQYDIYKPFIVLGDT